MARYHFPNPLDLLFFAIDESWRRRGLPSVDIHLVLELEGSVDLDGLRTALSGLRRRYPACGATLTRSRDWRRCWRLDQPAPPETALRVIEADQVRSHDEGDGAPLTTNATVNTPFSDVPATNVEMHLARFLGERRDYSREAPFQITVIRDGKNDTVLARWPHALMDARGGVALLEELAQLDRVHPNHDGLRSAGDELRRDFGALTPRYFAAGESRRLTAPTATPLRPPRSTIARLGDELRDQPLGAQRVILRRLSPAEFAMARDASLAVCGYARFADYVRVTALRALAETIEPSSSPDAALTAFNLIDNRKRRDCGPVCRNIFSAAPLVVTMKEARDQRRCAESIERQTHAMRESDWMSRRLAGLRLLTLLPTSGLAWLMKQSWTPIGPRSAPSLPLGFMGPPGAELAHFCGANVVNIFGTRPAAPEAGFSLNVNVAYDRLNICGAYWPGVLPTERIERFVDRFRELLIAPLIS